MKKWFSDPIVEVQGQFDPRFKHLVRAFQRIQPEDGRGGAALAVYWRGEKVVDVWAGQLKEGEAWQQDSMALSYSTGKGVLSTLVHKLVDQGVLDYDRPVAVDWPEFAAHGKQDITLRHILSHQSGMYDIRNTIQSAAQMLKWDVMLQAFEQATPRFEPGTATAYQAMSYGWLLGGLIEKATGKSLAQVLKEELVDPLQLDGVYFGVPTDQLQRVAHPIIDPEVLARRKQQASKPKAESLPDGRRPLSLQEKLFKLAGQNPYDADDALGPKGISRFSLFTDRALQACIPASSGVFTARALAKMYSMLANKGRLGDLQYLSEERFYQLNTIQTWRRDKIMPLPMLWRLGYHRILSVGKTAPQGFGHMGYNGSGGWCDPTRQLSFAFVHNFSGSNMAGDYRLWWLTFEALRAADQ